MNGHHPKGFKELPIAPKPLRQCFCSVRASLIRRWLSELLTLHLHICTIKKKCEPSRPSARIRVSSSPWQHASLHVHQCAWIRWSWYHVYQCSFSTKQTFQTDSSSFQTLSFYCKMTKFKQFCLLLILVSSTESFPLARIPNKNQAQPSAELANLDNKSTVEEQVRSSFLLYFSIVFHGLILFTWYLSAPSRCNLTH